jgi:hypothetical protein
MTKILPILMLIFTIHPLTARIGETIDECDKRYGAVAPGWNITEQTRSYRTAAFLIHIQYFEGRAWHITYQGPSDFGNPPQPLTEDQYKAILQKLSEKEDWRMTSNIGDFITYENRSGTQIATWNQINHWLTIEDSTTREARIKAEKEAKRAAVKKQTEGL